MTEERENHEVPKRGDVVKLKSGVVTRVIRVHGKDRWGHVEILIDGVRAYVDISDLEVLNALERLAKEL